MASDHALRLREIEDAVGNLKRKNDAIDRMLPKIGSAQDTADFREKLQNTRTENQTLCQTILKLLKANRQSDKQTEDLKKRFEHELKRLKDYNEQFEQKEHTILRRISQSTKAPPTRSYTQESQGQPQHQQSQRSNADSLDIQFVAYDVYEIQKRNEAIQGIERDVRELNEMFKDLNTLVVSQQQDLNTIEANIAGTKDNVVAAHSELKLAEEYQKKVRARKCFLLILILVVLALIVILAIVLTKR